MIDIFFMVGLHFSMKVMYLTSSDVVLNMLSYALMKMEYCLFYAYVGLI